MHLFVTPYHFHCNYCTLQHQHHARHRGMGGGAQEAAELGESQCIFS